MDDRRDDEPRPDEAVFASARVRTAGGRPTAVAVVAIGLLVAGLALAGTLDGRAAPGPTAPVAAATSLFAPGQPRSERFRGESLTGPAAAPAATPRATRGMAPVVRSEPGSPIELTIRRHPASMFVHGDVSVAGVSWLFVNITSDDGRIAGWTQVSVPGGASAPRATGPTLRFDVELALPAWATGPLSVRANAYASDGNGVASEELWVDVDGSLLVGGHGRLGVGD
jgi:hypothetical protein